MQVTPPLFHQLFTVHAERYGTVHPFVFALLPNKQEQTYTRFWNAVLQLKPNLAPSHVLTDFEQASISAIRQAFPHTQTVGCFFHFSQAVWRKVQQVGLQTKYNSDADFNVAVRQLPALAFVPPDHLENYFGDVSDALENFPNLTDLENQRVADLLTYFEATYLGVLNRRGVRRRPLFQREFWNVYDRTRSGLARTNNAVEAWHRGLCDSFNMQHPTIWKFITGLREEQNHRDTVMEGLIAGNQPQPVRRRYRELQAKILTIVNDFDNREVNDYVRGIANNITL